MRKFFVSYMYQVHAGSVQHGFDIIDVEGDSADVLDGYLNFMSEKFNYERDKIIVVSYNQI